MKSKEYLKQIATTEVIDCTYNDKAKKRIANIFPVGISAIEKDLEVLDILKKWIVVGGTPDDLFPYEIKVKQGYFSNKSCLVLIEEDYKKIKEWLGDDID